MVVDRKTAAVGRIVPCIPKQLYFYGSNIWRTHTLGIVETRGRITLSSNKTSSCGWSYDYSAIYTKKKYEELTEFYTLRVFLILTDRGNLVSKCQVRVIVGLRPPTGLGKIWENAHHAHRSVADTYVWVSRNDVKNSSRYTRFYPFILPTVISLSILHQFGHGKLRWNPTN